MSLVTKELMMTFLDYLSSGKVFTFSNIHPQANTGDFLQIRRDNNILTVQEKLDASLAMQMNETEFCQWMQQIPPKVVKEVENWIGEAHREFTIGFYPNSTPDDLFTIGITKYQSIAQPKTTAHDPLAIWISEWVAGALKMWIVPWVKQLHISPHRSSFDVEVWLRNQDEKRLMTYLLPLSEDFSTLPSDTLKTAVNAVTGNEYSDEINETIYRAFRVRCVERVLCNWLTVLSNLKIHPKTAQQCRHNLTPFMTFKLPSGSATALLQLFSAEKMGLTPAKDVMDSYVGGWVHFRIILQYVHPDDRDFVAKLKIYHRVVMRVTATKEEYLVVESGSVHFRITIVPVESIDVKIRDIGSVVSLKNGKTGSIYWIRWNASKYGGNIPGPQYILQFDPATEPARQDRSIFVENDFT